MRKTKVVATIGPATRTGEIINQLVEAGMDAARINASHARPGEISEIIELLKASREIWGKPLAIILDLMGPKIRVGEIQDGEVHLVEGQELTLTTRKIKGGVREVSVNMPSFPPGLKRGSVVLLDDGAIRLRVTRTGGKDVACRVEVGGKLKSRKGVSFPGCTLDLPSLTRKDLRDLRTGLASGADWIALSFVRSARDVRHLRNAIRRYGYDTPIIAKIEKSEALRDVDDIFREADAIMVARGDLGVERPIEEVPLLQKELIYRAATLGKPSIVATQMLESMISSPLPTRAEASDIANALFDGADGLMLSAETSVGSFPVEAVKIMARIIEETEKKLPYRSWLEERKRWIEHGPVEAVCFAACELARNIDARAIMAPTDSGFTAFQIARFRPESTIVALTPRPEVVNRLKLAWGVYPVQVGVRGSVEEMFRNASIVALRGGWARKGDFVVITAGIKGSEAVTTTNMIKLHKL